MLSFCPVGHIILCWKSISVLQIPCLGVQPTCALLSTSLLVLQIIWTDLTHWQSQSLSAPNFPFPGLCITVTWFSLPESILSFTPGFCLLSPIYYINVYLTFWSQVQLSSYRMVSYELILNMCFLCQRTYLALISRCLLYSRLREVFKERTLAHHSLLCPSYPS